MQKLITLIITAAIIYFIIQLKMNDKLTVQNNGAIATSEQQVTSSKNGETPALTGNFLEKTLSEVLINVLKTEEGRLFFENILQPINKPLAGGQHSFKFNNTDLIKSMYRINSFGEGSVGPAVCGHIVTIDYQILQLGGSLVEAKNKTYSLGTRPIIPGLDTIIFGMMVGQTRQAIIPAKFAFYDDKYRKNGLDPDASYKINVTLKELLPQNFIKDDEVKIFDDEIIYKMPLTCGDKVTFDAKITKLANGKILYNSEDTGSKLNMRIGDINYPVIFSYSLHNKIPTGTRTAIAKGKAFQSFSNKTSKIFPKEQLPSEEYFMLELSNFQVDEPIAINK